MFKFSLRRTPYFWFVFAWKIVGSPFFGQAVAFWGYAAWQMQNTPFPPPIQGAWPSCQAILIPSLVCHFCWFWYIWCYNLLFCYWQSKLFTCQAILNVYLWCCLRDMWQSWRWWWICPHSPLFGAQIFGTLLSQAFLSAPLFFKLYLSALSSIFQEHIYLMYSSTSLLMLSICFNWLTSCHW